MTDDRYKPRDKIEPMVYQDESDIKSRVTVNAVYLQTMQHELLEFKSDTKKHLEHLDDQLFSIRELIVDSDRHVQEELRSDIQDVKDMFLRAKEVSTKWAIAIATAIMGGAVSLVVAYFK